jgi:carbonic anhydrase/acetyltransferase-like protein (isoleucine patch superfamily)
MPSSPIDDLAALLKLDRAALEAAVPGIDAALADERLFGLIPLIAASAQRESASAGDMALRAQILQYHATDLMTDRERAIFLGLPEGCRIRERAKILAPEKLVLGRNVWIGEGAVLDAQGGLTIGDSSQIGLGVMVWSHSSHLQAIRGETTVGRDSIVYKETRIGKNCFIAGPSVIAAGVTIGDGAIISPLTFVDRDVAPGEQVSAPRSLKKLERRLDALERKLAELG